MSVKAFDHDPVLFGDRLAEAFHISVMGALSLEDNTPTAARTGNAMAGSSFRAAMSHYFQLAFQDHGGVGCCDSRPAGRGSQPRRRDVSG